MIHQINICIAFVGLSQYVIQQLSLIVDGNMKFKAEKKPVEHQKHWQFSHSAQNTFGSCCNFYSLFDTSLSQARLFSYISVAMYAHAESI
jgi:hypothetical protein